MKTQVNFKDYDEHVELNDVQDLDQLIDQISKYDICPDFFVVQYRDEEGDIIDVHDSVDFSLLPMHDSMVIVTKVHEGEGFHKKRGAEKSLIIQGMSESEEDFQKKIMNHKMFWNSIEEITDQKIDLRLRQFKKELIQEFKLKPYEEQKERQDKDDYYSNTIELLKDLRDLSKDMKLVSNEDVLRDIEKTHRLKQQKLQELNAQMNSTWNADYSDAMIRVSQSKQSQQKK